MARDFDRQDAEVQIRIVSQALSNRWPSPAPHEPLHLTRDARNRSHALTIAAKGRRSTATRIAQQSLRKQDVSTSKNYLAEAEIRELNRLTGSLLGSLRISLLSVQSMPRVDWIQDESVSAVPILQMYLYGVRRLRVFSLRAKLQVRREEPTVRWTIRRRMRSVRCARSWS